MPFADANDIVLKMGAALARPAGDTPLLAGVLATDQFRIMDTFIDRLRRAGYAGVQNFPSIGIVSGRVRTLLENSDMGYDCEVRLIKKASEKGLFCSALVFGQSDADAMARAGADMLVAHLPLTEDGDMQEWDAASSAFPARLRADTPGRAGVVLAAGFVGGVRACGECPAQYESLRHAERSFAEGRA